MGQTPIFPISRFSTLFFKRALILLISSAFLANTFGPLPLAQADPLILPKPGVMVPLSLPENPPVLKGIKVYPNNLLKFDFILDQGDSKMGTVPSSLFNKGLSPFLQQQSIKLIKYFLASLTVPDADLWVNLSPYEKQRIIPRSFGKTEMGRDLLAEDYILKQITASLIYPENETGKKFGTTNIPVNTFNKVWIVPEKAVIYENAKAGTAYVVDSKLKVMLEEDYLSTLKHQRQPGDIFNRNYERCPHAGFQANEALNAKATQVNQLSQNIIQQIIIPELNKEINQGANFAQLRQVYNSLILATWYKRKIKDSILAQVYEDKNKIKGIVIPKNGSVIPANAGIHNENDVEYIYQQYLKAFKKGVFNYIKEEEDPLTQQAIPRKYFSGGADLDMVGKDHLGSRAFSVTADVQALRSSRRGDLAMLNINLESLHTQVGSLDGSFSKFVSWMDGLTDNITSPLSLEELNSLANHYHLSERVWVDLATRAKLAAQASKDFYEKLPRDGKINVYLFRDAFSLYAAEKAAGGKPVAMLVSKALVQKVSGVNVDLIILGIVNEAKARLGLDSKLPVPENRFQEFKNKFFGLFNALANEQDIGPVSKGNEIILGKGRGLRIVTDYLSAYLGRSGITPELINDRGVRFVDTTMRGTFVLLMEAVAHQMLKKTGINSETKIDGKMFYSSLSQSMSYLNIADVRARIVELNDYPVEFNRSVNLENIEPQVKTRPSEIGRFSFFMLSFKSALKDFAMLDEAINERLTNVKKHPGERALLNYRSPAEKDLIKEYLTRLGWKEGRDYLDIRLDTWEKVLAMKYKQHRRIKAYIADEKMVFNPKPLKRLMGILRVTAPAYDARDLKELSRLQAESFQEIDGLTGLYSSTGAEREFSRLMNYRKPFRQGKRSYIHMAFSLLDIDHFKVVNEVFGHPQGDVVLKQFAKILQKYTRASGSDIVARKGGEEFLLVMPFSSAKINSRPILKKLLERINTTVFEGLGNKEEIIKSLKAVEKERKNEADRVKIKEALLLQLELQNPSKSLDQFNNADLETVIQAAEGVIPGYDFKQWIISASLGSLRVDAPITGEAAPTVFDKLYKQVDELLSEAKAKGRNQVVSKSIDFAQSAEDWVLNGAIDDIRPAYVSYTSVQTGLKENKITGLEKKVVIHLQDGRTIFIADDHNHALSFWWLMQKEGRLKPSGNRILHIDAHADAFWPEKYQAQVKDVFEGSPSLSEVDELSNKLGIQGFIAPLAQVGFISTWHWLYNLRGGPAALMGKKPGSAQYQIVGAGAQPQDLNYDILDIDVDVFNQGYSEDEIQEYIRSFAELAQKAKAVSIVMSPEFIDEAKALTYVRELTAAISAQDLTFIPENFPTVDFSNEPWYIQGHMGNSLYHGLGHSQRVGASMRDITSMFHLSNNVRGFLSQVAFLHDFDPIGIARQFSDGEKIGPRETNTGASVRRTIALLNDDWKGIKSLDGVEGKSYLKEVLGWNEPMFYVALAIIQRSEFPWDKNAAYAHTTPKQEYESYLSKVKELAGQKAFEFTATWAAYFSEYIDKASSYVRLDFPAAVQNVKDLAREINNHNHMGLTGEALEAFKEKLVLGTAAFMKYGVEEDNKNYHLNLMDWQQFIQMYPENYQRNFQRNKRMFEEISSRVHNGEAFDKVLSELIARDKAQVSHEASPTGGIDLTSQRMNLQTKADSTQIRFHIDPAMLTQLQDAEGFAPMIVGVKPLTNLEAFLGIS